MPPRAAFALLLREKLRRLPPIPEEPTIEERAQAETTPPPSEYRFCDPTTFDFRNPDYEREIRERLERLAYLRAHPEEIPRIKDAYRANIWQFICDWGVTFDPRNVRKKLPATMPFVLFKRQREWVDWLVAHWKEAKPGLTEKSKDSGCSWIAIAVSCSLCMLFDGMAIGFGSRKEEYVDRKGDPKSLFEKGRIFMANVPKEFSGEWDPATSAPHMRLMFPSTGSIISGEAGDNIGRGSRNAIYFIDESAFLERPELIDRALANATESRQDLSTPNGTANPFAKKRFSGMIDIFTFHWRDDPRKGDEWYEKQKGDLDPKVIAQEIDINYAASVEGIVIPQEWVQASIDAHIKLKLEISGERMGALDVADEGSDKNAFMIGHGILVEHVEQWSGKGSDIFGTTARAFALCDLHRVTRFRFDGDGLGASVRGDARVLNETRKEQGARLLDVEQYRGSEGVVDPEKMDVEGRTNLDYFDNLKAQAWWRLRTRFLKTWRWVTKGIPCSVDEIISISSTCGELAQLSIELSQATWSPTGRGKMLIDKAPDGSASPNLADSIVIRYAPGKRRPMKINPDVLRNL